MKRVETSDFSRFRRSSKSNCRNQGVKGHALVNWAKQEQMMSTENTYAIYVTLSEI